MLSNAYFLANFRFDTAENEPAKNLQNLQNVCKKATPRPPGSPTPPSQSKGTSPLEPSTTGAGFLDISEAPSRLYRRRCLHLQRIFAAFFKLYEILSEDSTSDSFQTFTNVQGFSTVFFALNSAISSHFR